MKPRTLRIIEIVTIVVAVVLILIICCGGCATDAMRRSWEQILADIKASEYDDAMRVSMAASSKYGKSTKHTDSTTTNDTIKDIESDITLKDVWNMGRGLLSGNTTTIGMGALVTLLLTFIGRKPIRRLLHRFTHNPKEEGGSNEVAKS